jgi:hypothetical protein
MRTMPRVFVASSGEAERLAEAIQQNLKGAEVTLWTQEAFRIGHTIIDELDRNLERSDFGVFVFAPNDIVVIRGQEQLAVRDNVLFELGMFIGRLGKERSFIVRPKGVDMRLPTDLLGIITAKYDRERATREPAAALGSACTQIADAIKQEHRKRMKEVSLIITESLETICWSMAAPETPELASLRAFIFKQENDELVCRGFWDPFLSTEQVGKTRFPINEETAAKVVVVRCFLDNETKRTFQTEGSSVAPLPNSLKGVKGQIRPNLTYVLAAPIRNENDTLWGVVDFDASNSKGKKLLQNEKTSNAVIQRLARDLSKILAR